MSWSVEPEPTDEHERRVLLAAAEDALGEAGATPAAYATGWWRSGLDELGRGPAAEQAGRDPGVVEP